MKKTHIFEIILSHFSIPGSPCYLDSVGNMLLLAFDKYIGGTYVYGLCDAYISFVSIKNCSHPGVVICVEGRISK